MKLKAKLPAAKHCGREFFTYLIYLLFIFKISVDTIIVTIKVTQQLNKL